MSRPISDKKTHSQIHPIAFLTVLGSILYTLAGCSAIGKQVGNQFLFPPEQPFPKTPADYGHDYEDVEFEARDGLKLSGWLLNKDADKLVIMTHFGYRANRYGYQPSLQPFMAKPYDHEIEFVKVAGRLIDAGYGVLMYDLRNHGISEKTKTGAGTGGVEEAVDVISAVEFLSKYEATAGKPIGLLSYCMGANATFIAYGKNAEDFKNAGVKALVVMQPLTNELYLNSMSLSSRTKQKAKERFEDVTGHDFNAPVLDNASSVNVPTIIFQGKNDPNVDMNFINSIYKSLSVEKELYLMEETKHRFDGYNYFYDHPEKMVAWFNKYV